MSQLWTDIITPQELTGYVRGAMEEYEAQQGTLSAFLPNQSVFDTTVRFTVGERELVEEARWRAYDAEPEIADGEAKGRRLTVDLPAVGQSRPVTEYAQLRSRNVEDEVVRTAIEDKAEQVGRAVVDAVDRVRGVVLATGAAVVDQDNFSAADDFGRNADLTTSLTAPFADHNTSVLEQFAQFDELYREHNNGGAAFQLMSARALRSLRAHPEFSHIRPDGSRRNASLTEIVEILESEGLPIPVAFDRKTRAGRIIAEDTVVWLPANGEAGGTFWGETVTSRDASFGIAGGDTPGLVIGAFRNPKPPMGVEVISDAIAWPILQRPNSTLAFTNAVA